MACELPERTRFDAAEKFVFSAHRILAELGRRTDGEHPRTYKAGYREHGPLSISKMAWIADNREEGVVLIRYDTELVFGAFCDSMAENNVFSYTPGRWEQHLEELYRSC